MVRVLSRNSWYVDGQLIYYYFSLSLFYHGWLGVDAPNENKVPLEVALNDQFRINYYRDYIGNMTQAMDDGGNLHMVGASKQCCAGADHLTLVFFFFVFFFSPIVDVKGYFAWALVDNFECESHEVFHCMPYACSLPLLP